MLEYYGFVWGIYTPTGPVTLWDAGIVVETNIGIQIRGEGGAFGPGETLSQSDRLSACIRM